MRHRLTFAAVAVIMGTWPGVALAHGGGLDASGCHTNRSTGEYHCHRAQAAPAPRRSSTRAVGLTGGGGGSFANCAAARAAGAAPVRVGDPGYGRHLDRDGDGVGCE